jgi:hypothetical protein
MGTLPRREDPANSPVYRASAVPVNLVPDSAVTRSPASPVDISLCISNLPATKAFSIGPRPGSLQANPGECGSRPFETRQPPNHQQFGLFEAPWSLEGSRTIVQGVLCVQGVLLGADRLDNRSSAVHRKPSRAAGCRPKKKKTAKRTQFPLCFQHRAAWTGQTNPISGATGNAGREAPRRRPPPTTLPPARPCEDPFPPKAPRDPSRSESPDSRQKSRDASRWYGRAAPAP